MTQTNITGASYEMARRFQYGGNPAQFIFSGLPGWTVINTNATGRIGLTKNAAPWAGNGAIPDGDQVLYIQENAGTAALRQTVTNLTAGERYRLSYRYAARLQDSAQNAPPRIKVSVNSNELQNTEYPVRPGASDSPFYLSAYEFTAAASINAIMFENVKGNGDTAVLFDSVMIEPAGSAGWTTAAWSNDVTAGIESTAHYTHAINLNSSSSATINGVTFKAAGLCYGVVDGKSGFQLKGLIPGMTYETTIFGVAWDNQPGDRKAAWMVQPFWPTPLPVITERTTTATSPAGLRIMLMPQGMPAAWFTQAATHYSPILTSIRAKKTGATH